MNKNNIAKLHELGTKLYRENKLNDAEKAFQQALLLNPENMETRYNYALLLTKKEQWHDAISMLEPVVKTHPDFAPAVGQLGNLYLQIQNYEKALPLLQKRVDLDPKNIDAQFQLAHAFALTHQIEKAIYFYENVLMQDSHHLEVQHYLANSYLTLGDVSKALTYFLRQLEINPLPETYYNIGVTLMYQERHQEALSYFQEVLRLDPHHLSTYLNLGALYLKQQNMLKAIEAYQHANQLDANNPEIQYILNALLKNNTPKRAPREYITHLFDQYAIYYDQHLTKHLHYEVPQKLLHLWQNQEHTPEELKIIDLGCGTGLSGEAFRPFAKTLIGVDLSQQMLDIARQKKIYDELILEDIFTALQKIKNADVIVAADVFSYFGDLKELLQACHQALKSEGMLLFSVGKSSTEPYQLQPNMRYAHHKNYIESLAYECGFTLTFENTILRTQQKKPVEGYVFCLIS